MRKSYIFTVLILLIFITPNFLPINVRNYQISVRSLDKELYQINDAESLEEGEFEGYILIDLTLQINRLKIAKEHLQASILVHFTPKLFPAYFIQHHQTVQNVTLSLGDIVYHKIIELKVSKAISVFALNHGWISINSTLLTGSGEIIGEDNLQYWWKSPFRSGGYVQNNNNPL